MPANLAARPEWHNMFTCSLGKSAKNVESTTRHGVNIVSKEIGTPGKPWQTQICQLLEQCQAPKCTVPHLHNI